MLALPVLRLSPTAGALAAGLCALNLQSLVINLVPRPPSRPGEVGTDGWRLRQLRGRPPRQTLAEVHRNTVRDALVRKPQASAGQLGRELLAWVCTDEADPRMASGLTLIEQYSLLGNFTEALGVCDLLLSRDPPPGVARLVACARAEALLNVAVSTGRALTFDELQNAHVALTNAAGVHGVLHSWSLFALVQGNFATAVELAKRSLAEDVLSSQESSIVRITLATARAAGAAVS